MNNVPTVPSGCPYAIQYCQDSVSSRLPKATAMLAEEPREEPQKEVQEEPQKEVQEQVEERVVKSSMRVVAADSPSQRRPRQGVYQQTRRPRQPTAKFVASRPSRRPKAPARLHELPEGFRGALRIPKVITPSFLMLRLFRRRSLLQTENENICEICWPCRILLNSARMRSNKAQFML